MQRRQALRVLALQAVNQRGVDLPVAVGVALRQPLDLLCLHRWRLGTERFQPKARVVGLADAAVQLRQRLIGADSVLDVGTRGRAIK